MKRSEIKEDDLVSDYLKGLPFYKCCIKYKTSEKRIREILLRNNITIRNKSESFGITKEVESSIVNSYTNLRKSQYLISKELNIPHETISNILKRNNIKIEKWQYNVNHNFFQDINTPEKAYFLGWMISDGCNKSKGIHINLQKKDEFILEIFKKIIEYEGPLYYQKGRCLNCDDLVSLVIYSTKLSEDLSKLGIVPNKSHYTYFPDIPEELYPYFIRGVFEGDGTISQIGNGVYRVGFSGTFKLMSDILQVLIKKCDINSLKVSRVGKQTTHTLIISGSYQALRVMNYLYKDRLDLVLKRKYEKIFSINPGLKSIFYNNMIYSINEVASKLSKNKNDRLKILRKLRKESLSMLDQTKIKYI